MSQSKRAILLSLVALIGAFILFTAMTGQSARGEEGSFFSPGGVLLPRGKEESPGVELAKLSGERYGVLVCGIDNTGMLADVILYAMLDRENKTLDLLQIPRDTYIGEGTTGKINSACRSFKTDNPARDIKKIVETQFHLPVDGCVSITLSGVRALVDSVGGVEMDVPFAINYLPGQRIESGPQTLNGEQTEWLLRNRGGYTMGDLDRLKVQKIFLESAYRTVAKLGRMDAVKAAVKCFGHIKTDLDLPTVAALISEGLEIPADSLRAHSLPVYGARYKEHDVLCVSRYKYAELLNEYFTDGDAVPAWDLHLQYPPEPQEEQKQEQEQPSQATPDGWQFDFSWDIREHPYLNP